MLDSEDFDFSQDSTNKAMLISEDFFTHETAVEDTAKSTANLPPEFSNPKVVDLVANSQNNPVHNLNLLRPGLQFKFQEEGDPHAKKFTASGNSLFLKLIFF